MLNKIFYPTNVLDGNQPVIPVEDSLKNPVAMVVKKRGFNFNFEVNSKPQASEDEKVTDARKFPLLRGFD